MKEASASVSRPAALTHDPLSGLDTLTSQFNTVISLTRYSTDVRRD